MGAAADILIVEDDKDLVNSLRIILEGKNYNVRTGHNGSQGYAEVEKKIPDLILLDVMMATDTDGFDLAYKLKNNPIYKDITVVMITGFTQKMAEKGPEKFQHILGESWPVTQILEKPIDPEVLLATIKELLD